MKQSTAVLISVLSAALVFVAAPVAVHAAVLVANGPDDICGPTDDPCIVDEKYQVTAPGDLFFGARALHIVSGGRLLGTVDITCGDLVIDVGTSIAIDSSEPGGVSGEITIESSGTITIDGKLQARGNPGGTISIAADDDVTINGRLLADGSPIGSDGGVVLVNSYDGSVTTNDTIVAKAVKGSDYEGVEGGLVHFGAEGSVTMNGAVETGGGHQGGALSVVADGPVTLANDVTVSSGANLSYGNGGYFYVYSYSGIVLTGSGPTNSNESRFTGTGSTGYYVSTYGYKYTYPGPGGLGLFQAIGGDLTITEHASLFFNSGPADIGSYSYGGLMLFYADGDVTMNGSLTSKGYGREGRGGSLILSAGEAVSMGPSSNLDFRSKYGGYVTINSDYYGGVELDGTINVRGNNKTGNGEYANYGQSGYIRVYGGDIDMDGKLLAGADGYGGVIGVQGCRFHAANTARIDAQHGSPLGGGSIYLDFEESIIADQGSKILADAQGGGYVDISYRSAKPPVLNGTIVPAPSLNGSPGGGCPVCGNLEIDAGESCDDGNALSGDGCSDECHNEGCVAQTPGFPGVPICFDGDACTVDSCDDPSSTCSNIPSCEEGIACTLDTCVAAACEHTPMDSLCDDFNPCTDDICNSVTGCVHSSLTGPACEDGDLCTVTGTCASGACIATDIVEASKNKAGFKFRDDPNRDRMSYKGEISLDDYTTSPAVTGMAVELRDSNNQSIVSAVIPAGSFEDKNGLGVSVSFRDKDHALATGDGVEQIKIKKVVSRNIAKVKMKIDDTDLAGANGEYRVSISMLFGTDPGVDDCVTARFIPCDPSPEANKNSCKDPS